MEKLGLKALALTSEIDEMEILNIYSVYLASTLEVES